MTKINIDGRNETKYPMRYIHGLLFDCIQRARNEIIKRGNDNIIRIHDDISR